MDAPAQARIETYFDAIGGILDNDGRRKNVTAARTPFLSR
jgi:hypothetical protein